MDTDNTPGRICQALFFDEGLKCVQGRIRWLIDSGAGHKFIYYISLDIMVLSFPMSGAGWIVENSAGVGKPWMPVGDGLTMTNPNGVSVLFPPPSNSVFYRLRKP
jgi:hypothetical protein